MYKRYIISIFGRQKMQCPKRQITFTPDMLEALQRVANESGNGVSAIVRIAVAEYLKKVEGDKK